MPDPGAAAAGPSAREHRDHVAVLLVGVDVRLAADVFGVPPSRQWSVPPLPERNLTQPSWRNWPGAEVGRERLEQVPADERQLRDVPDARQLRRDRLDHLLLAVAARVRSFSPGLSRFSRIRE